MVTAIRDNNGHLTHWKIQPSEHAALSLGLTDGLRLINWRDGLGPRDLSRKLKTGEQSRKLPCLRWMMLLDEWETIRRGLQDPGRGSEP